MKSGSNNEFDPSSGDAQKPKVQPANYHLIVDDNVIVLDPDQNQVLGVEVLRRKGRRFRVYGGGGSVSIGCPNIRVARNPEPGGAVLSSLHWFSWFLGKKNRECIALATRDLRKDSKEMQAEGCGRWTICAVCIWRGHFCTIIPILWDSIISCVLSILPLVKIAERLKKLISG